ncbi:hypothetical protein AYO40_05200 [Planctomycetaceae bacterium SCGC AG-212-D15]|nr:hypothetical protein AYO40_05200 [Planctomycetaceae bacterium SCGC AG-212-D15]
MITMLGSARRSCDGTTRRETLKVGALSLLGGFFNLPSLLALEQQRKPGQRRGKAKSVILLYLQGGPATQDMFDMKEGAKSEFKPVATSAPGVQICEHLPKMARWMHKACIVRSAFHKGICHSNLPMYTGFDDVRDEKPRNTDSPSMGSVCMYAEEKGVLKKQSGRLPSYIYLPCPLGWGEATRKAGPHGGFLGQRYNPLYTECTAYVDRPMKESDDMQVVRGVPLFRGAELPGDMTIDRLDSRRSLLQQLDGKMRGVDATRPFAGTQGLGFDFLKSAEVRRAFDLKQEPDAVRHRYGDSLFGNSTLLARRLVERGVRFVNVSWDNFRERFEFPPSNQVWDTHKRNFPILKENHLPHLDQVYSALMEDLQQRGLLDETLVVMMGEMGRTPKINENGGRDHWTFCYSVVLAGAGIRGGMTYGASDKEAAYVKDKPARIRDICATIYSCLGIDPDMPVYDQGGRPMPVANGGTPLTEILA